MTPQQTTTSAQPQANPVSQSPNEPADDLLTSVAGNIPVHNQAGDPATPIGEDGELDKIMHEVGQELKSSEKKPAHHHFLFERKHKKKAEAKFSAQPRPIMDITAQPAPRPQPAPTSAPAQSAAQSHTQSHPQQKAQNQPKPKKQKTSSAPVLAICLTVIITGALAAAAVYAYK